VKAPAELVRLRGALAEAERRYTALVEQLPVITYVSAFDETGTLLAISPQVEALLGRRPEEFLADQSLWERHIHPGDAERVVAETARVFHEDASFDCEYRVIAVDGTERAIWERDTTVRDDAGRPLYTQGVIVDITERRAAEAQVEHLAYHDALTGLPNRALLSEHLALALARAARAGTACALLYLDLDDFKLVNDSFGHAGGDELLRQVAARLDARSRAGDLLARQGGDEFLLLLTDLEGDPVDAAQSAAETLLDALGEPFRLADEELQLSASVGLSVYPRDASDADTLLRHADAAMYQAKASGSHGAAPYEVQAVGARERLALVARLRRAIEGDELTLHYQPVVSPATGRLDALEALVRWDDPERGTIPPGDFIPIAEETGLIEPLGAWVLEALCRQRGAWVAAGADPPRLHFNVSPRELRRADFAERVLATVARHGIEPGYLAVELTETTIMREHARSAPILRTLAEAGMRVAIDDFGSGYSSLTRLRELPVHSLKLDRAFLQGVPKQPESAAMVTAILELASALGMAAIAEGVETEAQRAFLVARGCPLAQGFHLGRPVPAAALDGLLGLVRATV
jgi:diguanylate cyclase (GGDEF)-like protein/PAS domain S-box-containing protein